MRFERLSPSAQQHALRVADLKFGRDRQLAQQVLLPPRRRTIAACGTIIKRKRLAAWRPGVSLSTNAGEAI
jgi:hypothetical protein